MYEALIDQLKEAGPDGMIDQAIEQKSSPDWRASHLLLEDLLGELRALPRYVPRPGELVLFVRHLEDNEGLAWDNTIHSFRCVDLESKTWHARPEWEAGIVTQMPQEVVVEQDLVTNVHKRQSIIYSGFNVEPLAEPNSKIKPHTKQRKIVPLHAIRPFTYWQDCLRGLSEQEWHPTIKHALTVSSSLCTVGMHRFRGVWSSATVLCRGAFIGSELVMVGDAVRLLPRVGEQSKSMITDVMVVSDIRLKFVNLDFDEDDLAPSAPEIAYQTCVHVTGRVYTTDPGRSFNGVSKTPVNLDDLPSGLTKYGPLYHYCDPKKPSARVEVPFSRILGRCFEDAATDAWFTPPTNMNTSMQPPSFKAVNSPSKPAIITSDADITALSRGLQAIVDARNYSQQHDARITATEQPWFWADTRIEQLDLHEVNDRLVGAQDPKRTRGQFSAWQKALKAMDGKQGGLEELEAARQERENQEKAMLGSSATGMLGQAAVETEVEMEAETESGAEKDRAAVSAEDSWDDAMEVDEAAGGDDSDPMVGSLTKGTQGVTIDLVDSDDEEDQRVSELVKNIRPGR